MTIAELNALDRNNDPVNYSPVDELLWSGEGEMRCEEMRCVRLQIQILYSDHVCS